MSTIWLDQKYASLVGTQLEQFKVIKTKPYSARFRCPVCGDSKTNRFKTRGYFYEHTDRINMKCHNCGHSSSLQKFIQLVNPVLYTEYRLEYIKNSDGSNTEPQVFVNDVTKFSTRRIDNFDPFKELRKISQLPHDHTAKKYILDRKIPSNTHYRIYYAPTYYHWVNSFVPDKFNDKALALDEPRIVLPFIDEKGYVFGFTGRAIRSSTSLRYSTIILDDTKQKVFGLDTLNKNKTVYIVEGPIDSLFLENCLAMAGSDVNFNLLADPNNLVVIYDNEPRNKEIVSKINKAINGGFKVCIWPEYINQKDINDMIKGGHSGASIQAIIDQNTYNGLSAKMRMQSWSKV
jgi:transcription elongation factor Elf1